MRERVLQADDGHFDDVDFDDPRPSRMRMMLAWVAQRPVDSFAGLVAAVGVTTILVNALFLQSGPERLMCHSLAGRFVDRHLDRVLCCSRFIADCARRTPVDAGNACEPLIDRRRHRGAASAARRSYCQSGARASARHGAR